VSTLWFALAVVVFAAVGFIFVRSKQKGAFVERLPIEDGENVLLEETGLKLFHKFRQMSARGGGVTTYRVRAVLTDRRILLATGGPEGKHKFVILMILDYTNPAIPVPETGYAAYLRKFGLDAGYPTYSFTAENAQVVDDGGPALRIIVPFPEGGASFDELPEVVLHTAQAKRYLEAVAGHRDSSVPATD
jgi:hypothetical protein